MQSGASSPPLWSGQITSTKHLELFAKLINCSMGPNLVHCVRGKAVEDILTGQWTFMLENCTTGLSQGIVGPIVDGKVLPDLPQNLFEKGKFHAEVDVMAGFTSHESAVFTFLRPRDEFQDGLRQNLFESIIEGQMLYAREMSRTVEHLVRFEYTNHADPDNKNTTRQAMLETFGDPVFVAPVLLEAKAMVKVKH